ncbi:LysM peptidoglycan-binding domain-containing protein [Paenibacillus sp. H1-7]|uniref:LysM peptidoglycan-binding domain-containing protein n=1 Tax=Paenibacillus sp. H1-7 TaxID=2282849 RepID=UPI001EF987EC|nr:LysM peptidoglycan-binding domain-containing protein [Paenibacillus sp. H1-7]ULL17866.1 LysM peptidoglycan-binding domain-containing protein [Paenibacillus sp. H1-7]
MAEQQSGLRFDIYERVHLSEGVAGIKELEGVELVPHIQVLPYGEQALLRGNLLLSGTYVDEQDAANRTLEHLIPVEITLPMNRVHRMEDIAVEIENFDVELLSTRSLNITGVLSLNGLEAISSFAGDSWQQAEDEVVFVHENREQQLPEEVTFAAAEPNFQPKDPWASPALAYAAANPLPDSEAAEPNVSEERHESWTAAESGSLAAVNASESASDEAENESEEAAETSSTAETSAFQAEASETVTAEDKKEMKIAFGKKNEDTSPKPIGLTTLLQSAVSSKVETRPEDAEPAPESDKSEKLEWKRLLSGPKHEQKEFKRLRLCIVQKEETLESIAKRYDLNPREIALFNRLGESDLSEGQIVYIPK